VDRLNNNYYRQKAALLHDIRLIATNCMTYNEAGSPISRTARQLVRALTSFVEDTSQQLPVVARADEGAFSFPSLRHCYC
jgi:hypothetical protein